MTTDPPEPKPRHKWHFYKWLVLLIVATFAYAAWNAYLFRSAFKEANNLKWYMEKADPIALIQKDWKAAFKKETWLDGVKYIGVPTAEHLEQHPDILRRLNPKSLRIRNARNFRDLSALQDLTRLEELILWSGEDMEDFFNPHDPLVPERSDPNAPALLVNLDALMDLPTLKWVELRGFIALTNLGGLKNLTSLRGLFLFNCTGLPNVDGIKNLTTLEQVNLEGCTGLTNVDALNSLPALNSLYLGGCTGLSKETIKKWNAALPNAKAYLH